MLECAIRQLSVFQGGQRSIPYSSRLQSGSRMHVLIAASLKTPLHSDCNETPAANECRLDWNWQEYSQDSPMLPPAHRPTSSSYIFICQSECKTAIPHLLIHLLKQHIIVVFSSLFSAKQLSCLTKTFVQLLPV